MDCKIAYCKQNITYTVRKNKIKKMRERKEIDEMFSNVFLLLTECRFPDFVK